jgi:bacillithiol system protein YtxJ
MNWIEITSETQLSEIQNNKAPSIIFKHSTRCPVSRIVKNNFILESVLLPDEVKAYHLDLIKYRELSSQIASKWNVKHESPQVLLIQNNECHYDASHNSIHVADIVTQIKE